jgi:cytoskeletal protein CcmA (bactofilin family)
MTKFIEFCKNRSTPELLPPAKYHCFGDWLSINAATPNDVIYEAYFALSTRLTARAVHVLGKTEDEAKYRALFDQIKAAFNKAYVGLDGRIKGDVTGKKVDAKIPSLLVLSAKGHIEGSIRCGDAVINGTVVGDLDVEHRLELQSEAKVTGTIRYRQLQMDVGAAVQGHLMRVEVQPPAGNVVELGVDKTAAAERR